LLIGQPLQHHHVWPPRHFKGAQRLSGKIILLQPAGNEIRHHYRIHHRLHAPLRCMRIHGMGRIPDKQGAVGHPSIGFDTPGRHVPGLAPIDQSFNHTFHTWIDPDPGSSQRFKPTGFDRLVRSGLDHREGIDLLPGGGEEAQNFAFTHQISRFIKLGRRLENRNEITFGIPVELSGDTEGFAHFGQRAVGAHHQPRRDIDRFTMTCRLQTDHPRAVEPKTGKRRVVPQPVRILLLQRIENGMVCHIRQRHQGAIVGRRQISVVHRTEPLPTRPAKVESTHRSHGMGRQLVQ
jgi:hypothetical protein